jgi:hypothetical protein
MVMSSQPAAAREEEIQRSQARGRWFKAVLRME